MALIDLEDTGSILVCCDDETFYQLLFFLNFRHGGCARLRCPVHPTGYLVDSRASLGQGKSGLPKEAVDYVSSRERQAGRDPIFEAAKENKREKREERKEKKKLRA